VYMSLSNDKERESDCMWLRERISVCVTERERKIKGVHAHLCKPVVTQTLFWRNTVIPCQKSACCCVTQITLFCLASFVGLSECCLCGVKICCVNIMTCIFECNDLFLPYKKKEHVLNAFLTIFVLTVVGFLCNYLVGWCLCCSSYFPPFMLSIKQHEHFIVWMTWISICSILSCG
jgi:hypothetical protein